MSQNLPTRRIGNRHHTSVLINIVIVCTKDYRFTGLPLYSAVEDDADRIVVPNDYDLRMRIMYTYKYHDTPTAGPPGREETYLILMCDFYWNHQYKWVRNYVRGVAISASPLDNNRLTPCPRFAALFIVQ
ncbi:hypothetical protein PC119_g5410 [Phytophthora cactorum]|uniref:Integrase zinc-binding domain-containing protein n=1 Tax=Phytophthora cactorum TaxID=29920 RepID=A0A8T1EA12_9STRA|nr:hypothetical protein PC114_g21871 [Phytophthora cactorum]KAG2949170.1 hypothetical protein PC117_g5494 [Phytophthora cactorum]KAG3033178.1 hypothetical protein PC119_g5410 [Phytophthora cactorum]KAG3180085.1 hypothetical protein C6341_g7150 [Phytophthora cactorum]KAG4045565.1 hypothetical protein PC123_g19034 [Phytophthora cactorum]